MCNDISNEVDCTKLVKTHYFSCNEFIANSQHCHLYIGYLVAVNLGLHYDLKKYLCEHKIYADETKIYLKSLTINYHTALACGISYTVTFFSESDKFTELYSLPKIKNYFT